MGIIALFIKRKITTAMIFCGICLVGVISASDIPVELLPDIELPALTVITPFENAAPSEVEKLVTSGIEEAVTSVSGVSGVWSESIEGMSVVKVNFQWGRDMDMALIGVKEKVDLIKGELPEKAGKSIVVKYDPADEPVMIYSVTISGAESGLVRRRAEKEIVPFIERINGVSLVELLGGDRREILVEVDNASLYSKNISLTEIVQSIGGANYSYPAGSLIKDGKEYLVRTTGEFRNITDIDYVTAGYSENGIPVYLKDVASIKDIFRERKSTVRFNGRESTALLVKKEPGKNTIKTCSDVKKQMNRFIDGAHGGFEIKCIYDQSLFIQSSIDNVIYAAALGGVIAFLVIWFFLKTPVPPLIISLSIPVSMAGTMILMRLSGISLNTMSLGGLAVGAGMMVDAGIVVLESIQDVKDTEENISPRDAAVKGTLAVAVPVTASVLTSIIVFLPIVFLTGLSGALFRDLALAVSFSLVLSLICSLTLIPMLSGINYDFLFRGKYAGGRRLKLENLSDKVMSYITRVYERTLAEALQKKRKIIISGFVSTAAGVMLLTFINTELMPSIDSREFSIEIELPGGTKLSDTAEICNTVERHILETGEAEYVYTKAGTDPDDNISEKISGRGPEYAEVKVFMKDGKSAEKFIEKLKSEVKFGERAEVAYRLRDEAAASIFSSSKDKAEVEIYGNDIDDLKDAGNIVKDIMSAAKGLRRVSSIFDRESPELRIDIDRKSASSLGLSVEDAAYQLGIAVKGEVSSVYHQGDDETDIRVRLSETDRTGIDALNRIIIRTSSGINVPVSKFAEIKSGKGSSRIIRREQSRINIVSADIIREDGFNSSELRKKLAEIKFREGVVFRINDAASDIREAFSSLGFAMALAVVFIYMLLASQFQSLKNPLIIMISILIMAPGVSLSLLLTGQSININSGIGLILLSGTVVNNAIVLFDVISSERSAGEDIEQALIKAGRKRLKPIMMTTLTTILALLPIAVGLGEGAELQKPLAVTVIGGMAVSTVLTLVFIPVVFSMLNERSGSGRKVRL